jgi:peroxiredoxin
VKKLQLHTGFLFMLLILGACSGRNTENIKVTAKLKLPVSAEVKLFNLGAERAVPVDSITVSNATELVLKGEVENSSLYTLRMVGIEDIYLVIHPDEKIILDIDNTLKPFAYTVTGSTDSRLVNELMTQHGRVRNDITRLSIEYEKSKDDPDNFELNKTRFDSIYDRLLSEHRLYSVDFIERNPGSLACIFALYQDFGRKKSQPVFDKFDDIEIYNFVDSNLTIMHPTTEAVIALNRDVTEIKEQLAHKKYSEKAVQIGRKSPEFEIVTLEGNTLNLDEFQGQPVIYLFFAVWDEESVRELLAINELKKQYRYRKLNIIGVSFDTSKEKLQTFIQEQDIQFPVACDYQYWESDYVQQFGLRAVPDILLLDKNHIIHKRNIPAEELIQIVTEWKKNNIF